MKKLIALCLTFALLVSGITIVHAADATVISVQPVGGTSQSPTEISMHPGQFVITFSEAVTTDIFSNIEFKDAKGKEVKGGIYPSIDSGNSAKVIVKYGALESSTKYTLKVGTTEYTYIAEGFEVKEAFENDEYYTLGEAPVDNNTIASKTNDEIENLLFAFDDEGSYFEGLDPESEYSKLSSLKKSQVISGIRGKEYDSCPEVVLDVNKLIDEIGSSKVETSGNNDRGGRGNVIMPNLPAEEDNAGDTAMGSFTDLDSVDWAKTAIEYLFNKGVINGKADGVYAPNDNVTRAEFIKIIVVAMGISGNIADTPFTDVDESEWYAPYIAAAYKGGVVLGAEDGAFYPNASITREDMATILYRALGVKADGKVSLKFTDANSVSDYAKESVGFLASKKIINGFEDGSFGPKKNATRAETAVMVYNAMIMGL